MDAAPRPNPGLGVFETLLIVDGRPVELEAHLDRLGASLKEVFGAALPPDLHEASADWARDLPLGRMRITVTPGPVEPRVVLATETVDRIDFFPVWEQGARLCSLLCEGGLGRHKWADRRPLARTGAKAVPLLIDRNDEVLEAGRANLFAVVGQALVTPMADGRILPGIARAGVIVAAQEAGIEVREERLTREGLFAADEVFISGSVRGVEPVRSIDGLPLPARTEISRRVGAGLRKRWLGAGFATVAPGPATAPPPGPHAR
jgi:para-aminobenzoate synthetase / 4-amino-4-deoxychorismate lyase